MCGIAGVLAWKPPWPTEALIGGMCGAFHHRGPDDEGIYVAGPVGLGMKRLSIIDLAGGHQPLFNETGEIGIVLNGEIYNYQELRARLESLGHRFTTKSDTEVAVHLYEERGASCVDELRGMFAFAVWDGRTRTLLLARDRFGKKPLYYAASSRGLAFASELKSLLACPGIDRGLDPEGLNQYLAFGNTLGQTTILAAIRKLPPAHVLIASPRGVEVRRYWQWRIREDRSLTEPEIRARLLDLLDEAVRMRLVSDVPLGAFLSGGLDSSTIVALMSRQLDHPVKTFSIGFPADGFDELPYCRQVASAFGTDHHELVLEGCTTVALEDLAWYLDEPFADSSAVPTYLLSKLARQQVTVAVSGDGGDELFAGYPGYRAEVYLNGLRRVPSNLRAWALDHVIVPITRRTRGTARARWERISRNLARVDMSPEDRFLSRHCLFPASLRARLLTEKARELLAPTDHPGRWVELDFHGNEDPIDKSLYLDINVYLPNDMLVKVDRMSMAHSLEVRCPLLDHKLAEFMATVPARYKVRGARTKHILRTAMAGILPASILTRGKQGFCVPLDRWLGGGLAGTAQAVLLDAGSIRRGLLDPRTLEAALAPDRPEAFLTADQIWALLMLECWCRRFLDAPGSPDAAGAGATVASLGSH